MGLMVTMLWPATAHAAPFAWGDGQSWEDYVENGGQIAAASVQPEHFYGQWCKVFTQVDPLPPGLTAWIEARPKLVAALVWHDGWDWVGFHRWPREMRCAVAVHLVLLDRTASSDPPDNLEPTSPSGSVQTWVSWDSAVDAYASTVANALDLEMRDVLKWSLDDYSADELTLLFDGRARWREDGQTFVSDYNWAELAPATSQSSGAATPSNARLVFRLLAREGLVGDSRTETISRVLAWLRSGTYHGTGSGLDQALALWDYAGAPPVLRFLTGRGCGALRYTGGCQTGAPLLNEVFRSLSIPTQLVANAHRGLVFPTEGDLRIVHIDDLYWTFRTIPEMDPFAFMVPAAPLYDPSWTNYEAYQAFAAAEVELQCRGLNAFAGVGGGKPNVPYYVAWRVCTWGGSPQDVLDRLFYCGYPDDKETRSLAERIYDHITVELGCTQVLRAFPEKLVHCD